ncbi:MAG: MGMT family protein [Gammaproteobacteria bacterium]|nr:MGMT family protein [Gammaproteobacteria bacterium]
MSQLDIREIIWQVVASIPEGKVATYGQVAKVAGYPSHARLVGTTLRKLPKGTTLPWHRVVNSQGKISFSEGSDAYIRQQKLLESEGVVFLRSKVLLAHYGW